jgi:hypothetical protein
MGVEVTVRSDSTAELPWARNVCARGPAHVRSSRTPAPGSLRAVQGVADPCLAMPPYTGPTVKLRTSTWYVLHQSPTRPVDKYLLSVTLAASAPSIRSLTVFPRTSSR